MNEEKEIWKDVPNYEWYYQCSNFGRVKSLSRFRDNGNKGYFSKEIYLKAIKNGRGYYNVNLCKNGLHKLHSIHVLISVIFLSHIPCGQKYVINHIDGDKSNNNLNNLEIVTQRDNLSICFRKDKNKFSSKYVGVYWHKASNKWISKITVNNKSIHLGTYINEIDASNAYQKELLNIKHIS